MTRDDIRELGRQAKAAMALWPKWKQRIDGLDMRAEWPQPRPEVKVKEKP